ncbi:tetratricopeptide repeat protein [Streptomyces sp. HC44]|uniref:Tetratricopeptide repeat protein n=1 Tax=Streptomyces scabichelini TaxID=2711217 RepID=A0A6G4VE11_9ACTN|nr:BTAD domain-containing putative transcriptional regulator [Streptomyces scabichelini]NGO12047.1 tetratricopeptide repeat protein [Streptomyces scabichelini]
MTLEFGLLGGIEARLGGRPLPLGHTRQRSVLAALLVDAGEPVPTNRLMERVWGDNPPRQARATLHGYVSRLRQALADTDETALTRRGGGYVIELADTVPVDLCSFRALLARARQDDDPGLLECALGLWRGEAFSGIDTPWFNTLRDTLEQERFAAQLDLNDRRLRLGEHAALLPALAARSADHPLDERLAGQLMLALHRSGRPAEALAHYQRIRTLLSEELGIGPGPQLREIQAAVLRQEDDPVSHRPNASAAPDHQDTEQAAPRSNPPPAQLPASVPRFTGRRGELGRLEQLLSRGGVVCLEGTAGVGKTALAVHWAHRARPAFPDGQLFVDLRGFDSVSAPTHPAEAVRGFLEALGVAPAHVPARLEQQTALYRSLMADRKALVLLDDARDAEQVRPLLPAALGSLTLVTSRNRLTSLSAAEGALLLTVDPLPSRQAHALLTGRLGSSRIAAEPAAVREITARCAGLPLALAVVAARAAAQPDFPLDLLARELREDGSRLDALDGGDPATQLRAAFSSSYRALDGDTARMFRLLGLHPGPDATVPAAAALTALPVPRARALLGELTRAYLLTEHRPGRYTCHDLLRAYAVELAQADDSDRERDRAVRRMLDHYLATARTADALLTPQPLPEGERNTALFTHQEAQDWLTAEHPVLLAAVERAPTPYVWQLAATLTTFLDRHGHWQALLTAQATALDAAGDRQDRAAQADAHRGLALALDRLGRRDEACDHYHLALTLYSELGSHPGQARTHQHLARMSEARGAHQQALIHARRSLEHYDAAHDPAGQSAAMNQVGWILIQLGNHVEALMYCRRALVMAQEADDFNGQAHIQDSLGCVHRHLGRYEPAVAHYRQAAALFRETGDRHSEARDLCALGDLHEAAAHSDAAREAWTQALSVIHRLGLPGTDPLRVALMHRLSGPGDEQGSGQRDTAPHDTAPHDTAPCDTARGTVHQAVGQGS